MKKSTTSPTHLSPVGADEKKEINAIRSIYTFRRIQWWGFVGFSSALMKMKIIIIFRRAVIHNLQRKRAIISVWYWYIVITALAAL